MNEEVESGKKARVS